MDSNKLVECFHQGHCIEAYKLFGAHFSYEGSEGVRFTVYAPHARNIFVMGSFTEWTKYPIRMERTDFEGIWSVFVKGVKEWDSYKYRIENNVGEYLDKADPYAFYAETRPNNASKVYSFEDIRWHDQAWMKQRTVGYDQPMNIYEVFAGGWKKNGEYPYTYQMMEENLIPYVKENGYTHIEMMPLTEYPFDGSWGYQASGYYALTSRYGNPTEFASFVDECHRNGIGIIMDMVPVHFVKDEFGLNHFDGSVLYEYEKQSDAESQWGTMNFNLWKEEVRSFLISSACFWCDAYHIDGIRIDAVSNLIYWDGNRNRGTNEGSLDFVKRLNECVHVNYPGVMMIAEDSSDYPKVTGEVKDGGLGFDYKWDLGWMNDTLKYYSEDPLYRGCDHHKLTFSMAYFYSERFLLPFSHDENVHGKKTIIDRMWGSYDDKFSQVRNLYAYMYAHPGKKLNFMGNEIASFREFDERRELDWFLLDYPRHQAFVRFTKDLNHLYLEHTCLYQMDDQRKGYQWINADNSQQSIYSFYRQSKDELIVCIMNCRKETYDTYDIEVPKEGIYREILNTENQRYDGCGLVNEDEVTTWNNPDKNAKFKYKITIKIAPYAAIWLKRK